MKVALVAPHIFMDKNIISQVIFSPGFLCLDLAENLAKQSIDVTLFSVPTLKRNGIKYNEANMKLINNELAARGYGLMELMSKHPLLFTTLSRQIQSKLISDAFKMANDGKFDVVHMYMNEEELGVVFSDLCKVPVVFTHHEPYNFLSKYRTLFPQFPNKNWISISKTQRNSMPKNTTWIGNVYHGIAKNLYKPIAKPSNDYFAYFGRIIEPKGVDLAIKAAKKADVNLKIAGKFYSGTAKSNYWEKVIKPQLDNKIEYVGFLNKTKDKNQFLGNAKALIIPSIWEEPFGMVMIEALACGTPLIGLNNGAIPEIIKNNINGILVKDAKELIGLGANKIPQYNREKTIANLAKAIKKIDKISRKVCRKDFLERFTVERMTDGYIQIYKKLQKN